MSTPSPQLAAATRVLSEVFGYPFFRHQQGDIVEHVLLGHDALVLMPTGGGKSLCYQVPAIVRQRAGLGVAVVVSPLIALMHDQVQALAEVGVDAAFLNSTLGADEASAIERRLTAGELTLLYAAPERVTTPRFLATLASLYQRGYLSLFAIDEAHCVSQWGHDFRAEYLELAVLHERFPNVPRLALTATADAHTQKDIVARLQLAQARVFTHSFDRPNIRYRIVERDNPRRQLTGFLAAHAGDAGIIYCGTRKKTEETAAWLSSMGRVALPYHAGLEAAIRRQHQDRFLREDGIIIVATVAFGMGIDKPNVRFVAHLDLPKNIEAYYQETGRAGRDGEPAQAWMLYGLSDVVNQRRMIDESTAEAEFKRVQRGKLEALLALAEAHDCRRVRLLSYFGEPSKPCGNCDNCLNPPEIWDASQPAQKLLSCVYRFAQHGEGSSSARSFGAGHLIDVLSGKRTDKVLANRHETLSTFGIGTELKEAEWRSLLRQLVAKGHVFVQGEFNTLSLGDSARAILKGEQALVMRKPTAPEPAQRKKSRRALSVEALDHDLDTSTALRLVALRTWRRDTAKARNLPAYVIFHDSTLTEIARRAPDSLESLSGITGLGAKKLAAYGDAILSVLAQC